MSSRALTRRARKTQRQIVLRPIDPFKNTKPQPTLKQIKQDFYNRCLDNAERNYFSSKLPEDKYAALFAAVQACMYSGSSSHPAWVELELRTALQELAAIPGRGRYNSSRTQRINQKKHLIRWATVFHLRQKNRFVLSDRPTWEEVYEEAATILKGTIACGSVDTMKASYKLVAAEGKGTSEVERRLTAKDIFKRRDLILSWGSQFPPN